MAKKAPDARSRRPDEGHARRDRQGRANGVAASCPVTATVAVLGRSLPSPPALPRRRYAGRSDLTLAKIECRRRMGGTTTQMTRATECYGFQSDTEAISQSSDRMRPYLKEIGSWREELRSEHREKEPAAIPRPEPPSESLDRLQEVDGLGDQKKSKEKKFVEYKVKDALGAAG